MPNSSTSVASKVLTSSLESAFPNPALAAWNETLETKGALARTEWAMDHLPGNFVLSSSFGIQSAVMLHLSLIHIRRCRRSTLLNVRSTTVT